MDGFEDAFGLPESPASAAALPSDDDPQASPFQEINERRARVENAELLSQLRGL